MEMFPLHSYERTCCCCCLCFLRFCGAEVDPKAKQGLCAGCGVPLVPFLTSCIFTRPLPRGSFRRRSEHELQANYVFVPLGLIPGIFRGYLHFEVDWSNL